MKQYFVRFGVIAVLLLAGSAFALAQDESASETKTLFVGPITAECVGVGPQTCMLVRENPEDDFTFFYNSIDGFEYEEGYDYELLVEVSEVENPPADASSLSYTLVEVVSMTRALEGNLWEVETYRDGEGNMVSVFPGTQITIQFRDGNVGGNASCNVYSGTYERDGQNIEISENMIMTMMMCAPEEVAVQEQAYISALTSATSFEVSDTQLQLFDADGEVLIVYNLVEPVTLTGTDWVVTGYNNGREAVVSVILGTELTAVFAEDGTVSGSAGCNNFNASYEVSGDSISIGPAASTRMFCVEPEGIMEQEQEYLAALEGASTYTIQNDVMEFFDANGSRMATFVARTEVVGIEWQWQTGQSNGEFITVPNPENYTLLLNEDGTLNVQADCNSGGGEYEIASGTISIDVQELTEAMCDEDSMSELYLQSLASVNVVFAQSNALILLSDDGSTTMTFTAG